MAFGSCVSATLRFGNTAIFMAERRRNPSGPVPPIETGRRRCWAWVIRHPTAAAPLLPGCRGGLDRHQCPLLTAGSSVPAPLLSSASERAAPACARDKGRRRWRAAAQPPPVPQSPPIAAAANSTALLRRCCCNNEQWVGGWEKINVVTHACAYGRYSVKKDARTVDADLWVCLRRRWRCVAVVHVLSLAAVDIAN